MLNLDLVRKQLQLERSRLQAQLARFDNAIAALNGVSRTGVSRGRGISAAGRARIAAAQRARWAKVKGRKVNRGPKPGKRKLSQLAVASIRRAQKARWAKWRQEKKSQLRG